MDGRKRTVQIKFRVTEQERDLIFQKMAQIPTNNLAAYLRKQAIENSPRGGGIWSYKRHYGGIVHLSRRNVIC